MKLNLIFKRVVEGSVEMIVVPVDLPQVDAGQGWTLASSCNKFTVVEKPTIEQISKQIDEILPAALKSAPYKKETNKTPSAADATSQKLNDVPVGGAYQSLIAGSARLVRYKDKIKITYRKGKTTFNKNEPNSVCISDFTKQEFFNAVKRAHGPDVAVWQLVSTDSSYEHFNNLIDKLYEEGRIAYNKLPVVSGEN